jgi:tetratricopeptide (TPR) repeat protein
MSEQVPPSRRSTTATIAATAKRPARSAQRAPVGRAPTGTMLVCTLGPSQGTEFPLSGDAELVIGRATDNPISIPDTSVSRRHCAVRKGPDGWTIRDLGSGNGTLINDERIDGEVVLRNADTITIGDTELAFADAANITNRTSIPARPASGAVPSRPRPGTGRGDARARLSRGGVSAVDPKSKARKLRVVLAVLAVVMMAGGGLVYLKQQQDLQAQQLAQKQQALQAKRAQLGAMFQEAKNLVRDYRWAEAQQLLEEIAEVAPEYPGVKDYLDRAAIEIPNGEHLDAALAALEKDQLHAAVEALGKVSADTQQERRLIQARSQLTSRVTARLAEANAAFEQRSFEKAVAITEDLLKARPDNRDASVLNENARRAIELRNRPAPVVATAQPRPWVDVVRRYVDGDLSGALALADECALKAAQCRQLARQIRDFAELYRKVEELDAGGLGKLLNLDKAITDGQRSKMARTAGTRAANLYFRNASSARVSGQWGKAAEWAKKAVAADPSHAGAAAIVQEVNAKARDVFMMGYTMKDQNPDEAVVRLREVLAMTAPGDEYYDKAQTWISRLSR